MITLFSYWRSSAAYRVRIALALKDIAYESAAIHLLEKQQSSADYLKVNPQGLVPALAIDGLLLAQSQAIVEYLDETRPAPPLLPKDPAGRADARRLAQMIVADLHPLNNTRVGVYLRAEMGLPDDKVTQWIRHWISTGLAPLEELMAERDFAFCCGNQPMLPDLCLVPQMYNARRFSVDLSAFPRLSEIDANCQALRPFQVAHPDRQPDAPVKTPD